MVKKSRVKKSIAKEARRLTKAAKVAVDAYQENPDCEDTRKRAKAAKVEAEKYVDDHHFHETDPMFAKLEKIHKVYMDSKYGEDWYYLMP